MSEKPNTKTINMPGNLADKWLAALRSGEYKQGVEMLERITSEGAAYCCLGVLQKCISGEVYLEDSDTELPALDWLRHHCIDFIGGINDFTNNPILDWKEAISNGGNVYMEEISAAELNDRAGYSFQQIADLIDQRLKRLPDFIPPTYIHRDEAEEDEVEDNE